MPTMPRPLRVLWSRPYPLLLATTLGWGCNTVAGRLAVGEVSPMAVVTLRWVIVVAALAPLVGPALLAERKILLPRLAYLLAMGGLGFTGFNAFYYWAAQSTTAVNMGVIQGVIPAIVLAGSALLYRMSVRRLQVAGLVLTLAGIVVMTARGDAASLAALSFNPGDLGVLAASLLYAGYTLALRQRPPVTPLAFFAAVSMAAFLTSLPLLAWEIASGASFWPTAKGWAIVVFIALVPSLGCQLLYLRGVDLIGPARAGLFMNLIPVISALLGVALLGEPFAAYQALALAAVLGGIWLAERKA